ncbi:diguanylate cyclase domain-containing protein [Actinoplanes sp. CA-030573]|uniref:diguanylate cyclase domain-containing protein n=1 Tax=Actinoplanes sp. CA-030573 TaxID=3239898 RepID=UPI003D93EB19
MSPGRYGAVVPGASAVLTAALSGWYLTTHNNLRLQVWSCWFVVGTFASMMGYFAYRASRRIDPTDTSRRFWTAFSVAGAVFGLGELGQLITAATAPFAVSAQTGTGAVRTAALAVGGTVLTVVVLTYPIPHRSARERLCYLLDMATVITAAGAYGLYWTIASAGGDGTVSGRDLATVVAGPVVAMSAAFAVGRLFLSGTAPFRWPVGVMGPVAAGVEAVARALGPELVRAGRPGVIFTMTVCSHALLMTAAWSHYRSSPVGRTADVASRRRPFSMLPYAALGATIGLLVVTLAVSGLNLRAWVALAGVIASTGMVVARQLTAFVDNARLLRERDALAARLHEMAFTDSLTGLANRAMFLDRLADRLRQNTGRTAVLLIDLDDFKPVNDSYGHAAGDAVLVEAAARMRSSLTQADVVARLGGDEFAVLLDRPHPDDIAAAAARMVELVGEPCRLADGRTVAVRASVGIALASGADDSPSTLVNRVDEAMYAAKCSGKNSVEPARA